MKRLKAVSIDNLCLRFVFLNDDIELASDTIPFVYEANSGKVLCEREKHLISTSDWLLCVCLKASSKKFQPVLSPFICKTKKIDDYITKSITQRFF